MLRGYWALVLLCVTVFKPSFAGTPDDTLQGASSVLVRVNISATEDTKTQLSALGVTEDNLRADVELLLRQSNIKFVGIDEWKNDPSSIRLHVDLVILQSRLENSNKIGWAVAYDVKVSQAVRLVRGDGADTHYAITWGGGMGVQTIPRDKGGVIRSNILDEARKFAAAFARVNPK